MTASDRRKKRFSVRDAQRLSALIERITGKLPAGHEWHTEALNIQHFISSGANLSEYPQRGFIMLDRLERIYALVLTYEEASVKFRNLENDTDSAENSDGSGQES